MPEPQDIAALREAVGAVRALFHPRMDGWTPRNRADVVDAAMSRLDAAVDQQEAERERGRALRAAVEALGEEWEAVLEECRATDPRWVLDRSVTTLETAHRELTALLAAHVPSPLLDGGAGEGDR